MGEAPVESLYVDPLESNAVLKTVLMSNTTFLVGRKGTGKSTVFAKAQLELRKRTDVASVYIDVKSLYELLNTADPVSQSLTHTEISDSLLRAHLLRKALLGSIVADLIKELKNLYESSSLFDRWVGNARSYTVVVGELERLSRSISEPKLSKEELPILQTLSLRNKSKHTRKASDSTKLSIGAGSSPLSAPDISVGLEEADEEIANSEHYEAYADAVLRSYPFHDLLERLKELLRASRLLRLFIFFDDFSELSWIDQKLFVDVILAPLNNASDEMIRLKVAGYPGRVYHGKIDPGKIDTISLDFYQLYKAQDVQTSEAAATAYLKRLLEARFNAFGQGIEAYFDKSIPIADHYRLLFEVTLNVPRLIGYILHYLYLDRVTKGLPITGASIRLASQKYFESVLSPYFDRMNRFAMEPFERKLDRHNQQALLKALVEEARSVRRNITTGQTGGKYFEDLPNPPVSHFTIQSSLESLLSSLELNMLVTKYHEMRDKNGKDVSVYAFFYGLCEAERFPWGYPRGRRDDRSYFVQRCFNFNGTIHTFLASSRTIRCTECGACFGMEQKESIELYKWSCPECRQGVCKVISLEDDFKREVALLEEQKMLPAVELEILQALEEEARPMRASQIAALVDATYQLVGHRTAKLHEMGLVHKATRDAVVKSQITTKAKRDYFNLPGGERQSDEEE